MTGPASSDVWAPPEPKPDVLPITGGPQLVYTVSPAAYRRETRAWIRATRWWAHPFVAVLALVMLPIVGTFCLVASAYGVPATPLVCFWVIAGGVFSVPVIRPFSTAVTMSRARDATVENHVGIADGEVVLSGRRELRVPVERLTHTRERKDFVWLCFGKRLVLFIPRRPRLGDVEAFMEQLRAGRDQSRPYRLDEHAQARAAFAPPSRWIHIARTYAFSLRSPLFLLLVVFAALSLLGAVASMPWQVSQILVIPLLILSASLVFLLATPAMRIGLGSRHRLGEPGTVTVWSASDEYLRVDSANGVVDIPWTDVVGIKRIGGFAVVELNTGKLILGLSDAVSGDPLALFQAIDSHAGRSDHA